ncbi:uncharacterized protein LOC143231487 [Tachypleus tridentatus]|uniref:uncharacterized protein LOC143231487 n=1 Tax=Tachypleus tridentatus TaxID=6853 RepID=UPI003FCFEA30
MIRVFFLLLLLAFGSVTKTFNTYPPNQRNIINRINMMVQPEMTDEKSGAENLTKQHCEYIFQSIDIQENIFKEGGLSARLEHPFLDLAKGIVPGISYSVFIRLQFLCRF